MAGPETVAELRALVVAGLKVVVASLNRGHTHKAKDHAHALIKALGAEPPAGRPVLTSHRPKGFDWKAILPAAVEAGESRQDLAKRLGCAEASVRQQEIRHGIQLIIGRGRPKISRPSTMIPVPVLGTIGDVAQEKQPAPVISRAAEIARAIPAPQPLRPAQAAPQTRRVMDDWKRNRIREKLLGGRKLEEVAKLCYVPLELVEQVAASMRGGV